MAADLTAAARDVLRERRRQIDVEGFTAAQDDAHADGSIAQAAAAMAGNRLAWWPRSWAVHWFRGDLPRRRQLVIAAALIIAEIERLDRAAHTAADEVA